MTRFALKGINILIIALMSFLVTSCFDTKDENTWVVGTSADNPPYEFMQNGKIVGFDVDLINEIAKNLGKKVEFKNMEFHGLIAALATSNVDMVIAGLSITPERKARVDFTVPYTDAKIAFLYRAKDDFKNYYDLTGKKVGAQLGTIWSLIAYDLSLKGNFKVIALSNNLMLVEDLKAGRIDGLVIEDNQAAKFIEINPSLSKFLVEDLSSSFAIALPKGSNYKKKLDHTIKSLKSNGSIEVLRKKWGV